MTTTTTTGTGTGTTVDDVPAIAMCPTNGDR